MYDCCECGQPLTQWTCKYYLEDEDWERMIDIIIIIT